MGYQAVIDVSEHQGAIDFAKMAATGVVGVIPRAGINGRRDKTFDANVAGTRAAGLALPAVYWFANPKSSTAAAAQGSLLGRGRQPGRRRAGHDRRRVVLVGGGPNPVVKGLALARWYSDMADAILAGTGAEADHLHRRRLLGRLRGPAQPRRRRAGPGRRPGPARAVRADPRPLPRVPARRPDAGTRRPTWADWAFGRDRRGPAIPVGCKGPWAGWQFSAGFNGQGPTYGVGSADLDLNIVTDDAWARWTGTRPDAVGRPTRRPTATAANRRACSRSTRPAARP